MATYSEEFKEKMAAKILHPEGPTVIQLCEESGVSKSALYQWVEHFKNKPCNSQEFDTMDLLPKEENDLPSYSKSPKKWSAADKLRILNETYSMSEEEVGAYCRRNGLYSNQLAEWHKASIEGLKPSSNKEHKLENIKLKSKIKTLESELTRKEKALAETAALLILKKKAHVIWGGDKDD